jgi:hypothetical protein
MTTHDPEVPEPDLPPPTMPAEAHIGRPPPPPPADADQRGDDGELLAGGIPPGTGPEVPAAPGTAEAAEPDLGVHSPDAGPGGADFDTDEDPLASRPRSSR